MLLWTAIALMTGAAIFAVLWPLRARPDAAAEAGGDDAQAGDKQADLAVYRDQLAEIDRDRASGLIGAAEGEAARTEIARRMLRAADEAEFALRPTDARRRMAAVLALIGVPLLAGGFYLALGTPAYEGQPLAARLDARPEQADIAILVRKVEAHLEANPEDGRGYEVIAPVYSRLGRFDDAARAWSNAIRLLGDSAPREAGLGEALVASSEGVVTVPAKAAFEKAVELDPTAIRPRYYLGLAAEQDGRPADAAAIWSKMLAGAPADAPWRATVADALARVSPGANPSPGGQPAPGPDAAQVAAAANMTQEQRADMVRGMVDGLQSRLDNGEGGIDEWLRLIRARSVLGEADKAKTAAGEARKRYADDSAALSRIDALTRELGLGS